MKNLYSKIIATGMAIYALLLAKVAMANSPVNSPDAIISRPVGQGVLPGAGVEGSDIQSSVLFAKIIPFLITWAINLAIGLAVIMLIVGGYMYMTAYGDDEKRQRGTRAITYSLIGLVIALTAYGIVTIVTSIRLS